ncbi:2-(1,2-epoxy-1,2-dihydrophenyl)acetyl-CoA isomerase [Lacihabitans sp. LS3-19]|uniref:enoyl-CoA hydratase/isomerase family protein n=1 Tax=Lacihabitans sp. LS3-19 TaxID=2487335 RepID=UPI0020CED470|nr:enoyl-CoA hydratase-related protein [Lacihabitans sp. LS3-19]MCP9767523.1 2-(1,2-epoxy-1,2-dihydrophenyl)acetyl-CoA isomerase [Lacihabitans sp. LS3-19]
MFQTILFNINQQKAYIQLNRPEVYNALNQTLLLELTEAIDICKNDENIRVVIISGGNGKAFCSGADLKSGLSNPNLGEVLKTTYNPLITGMRNLEKPIICKLNGIAAGAGMSLVLACDVIIADKTTYMSELFVGIGLLPDAGSMYFLPRMIGTLKAFELCSTGRKVFMEEAEQIGLINKAVEGDKLEEEVEKLANVYANSATRSIGLMKQILNKTFENDLEGVLNLEAEGQTKCGHSHDFAEGVMAFLQKREANFKGK